MQHAVFNGLVKSLRALLPLAGVKDMVSPVSEGKTALALAQEGLAKAGDNIEKCNRFKMAIALLKEKIGQDNPPME